MTNQLFEKDRQVSAHEAAELEVNAGQFFQPRTPITTRELFSGRWAEVTRLADVIGQPGLHAIIYGERGVGKTSLANVIGPVVQYVFDKTPTDQEPKRLVTKGIAHSGDTFSDVWRKIFDEINWLKDKPAVGFKPGNLTEKISVTKAFGLDGKAIGVSDVRRILAQMPGAVFIVDEFDRAVAGSSSAFTDLIKSLSDYSLDCTVILVGVSNTVDALIADHASIGRALVQVNLPRMSREELRGILMKAQDSLKISFSPQAESVIVHVSQGFPHYTHLLGREAVRLAARRLSRLVERVDAIGALKEAVKQAQQSVTDVYVKATSSSHQHTLHKHVLLACAVTAATTADKLGFFTPGAVARPLSKVVGKTVPITTFNKHLKGFCEPIRGSALERSGKPNGYRYRFRDPLLVPYIFMDAVATDMIFDDDLAQMLADDF